jgi:ParB family chromosome partitioning protein
MDEAEAFAKQLQAGGTVEEIGDKTGLSVQTVKRRLALATLCPEAKKAFRAGTIGRSVAEALTVGSKQQQRSILESFHPDYAPDPEEIRDMLIGSKPSVSMAAFPRERYTGNLTTDLFADDETTYFDDVDQFLTLQREAVEALAEERRKSADWVEVFQLYTVPWWQYREREGDGPAGVVINLHPSGSVEVREGLVRHEVKETVVEAARQTPLAPRPASKRPEFSGTFCAMSHASGVPPFKRRFSAIRARRKSWRPCSCSRGFASASALASTCMPATQCRRKSKDSAPTGGSSRWPASLRIGLAWR